MSKIIVITTHKYNNVLQKLRHLKVKIAFAHREPGKKKDGCNLIGSHLIELDPTLNR